MIRWLNMSITDIWMAGVVALGSGLLELAAFIWPDRLPVITRATRSGGQLWTIWPFLLGFIPAHIYSPPQLAVAQLQRAQPVTVPLIFLGVVIFDVLVRRTSPLEAFFAYLLGVALGATFWNTAS